MVILVNKFLLVGDVWLLRLRDTPSMAHALVLIVVPGRLRVLGRLDSISCVHLRLLQSLMIN